MPPKALSRFAERCAVGGSRHRRARWSIHSGQSQRRGHSGRCGVCPRHSGEARDRLWRSGSPPSISTQLHVHTPFYTKRRATRRPLRWGAGALLGAPRSLPLRAGLLHEYMGHDVSNMRGFDSYQLLTLSLAALMTRISSAIIEGAHTSAGAATLARTVPFWVRFRSPREPTAGPCRGCLLPSATNTAPSRHHLQAVLCDGWDVQTPPSWLLRPQTRELYGWS